MQEWIVTQTDAPRLEAVLRARFPQLPAGALYKYVRENKIKVDGKRQPLSARLTAGSVVRVYLPDALLCPPAGPSFLAARAQLTVVYEDSAVLAVEKPAGLLVADEKEDTADTLIHRVWLYLYQKGEYALDTTFSPCLCHRLDTGTSGLVLIAKTVEAEQALLTLIREREIEKQYLCVTVGHPKPPAGELHGYLTKDAQNSFVRVTDKPAHGAKQIVTRYRTLTVSGRLALLDVTLVTGRTHQIRAHMAHIGCPVLGDSKYGDQAVNRALRLKYQALCAYRLRFPSLPPDSPCAALSGKTLCAASPWYVEQVQNGILK